MLLRFGQEAVLVFFLLSGFVIFANERTRALKPAGYLIRRFRRIYPPMLVAMAVSAIIAFDNGDLSSRFSVQELLATLASVQDISSLKPGVISNPFLGNSPLWSLSYEMSFYLAFPLVLRLWARRPTLTQALVGAISCISYGLFVIWPNHFSLVAAYFLVWWGGAMAADAYLRGATNAQALAHPLSWLVLLCMIAGVATKVVGFHGAGYYPFLPLRHFAAGLVMLLVFFSPLGAALASRCVSVARPAALLASISYGLYVLHYPILVTWKRAESASGLLVAVVVLILSAYLADRQLNKYLPRAPRD